MEVGQTTNKDAVWEKVYPMLFQTILYFRGEPLETSECLVCSSPVITGLTESERKKKSTEERDEIRDYWTN